jgi:hypothetical protein
MHATQATSGLVDTGKVAGRRSLRFESTDQVMAEVDRLVEAEHAGRLKRLGNWTLGQALGHLSVWGRVQLHGRAHQGPVLPQMDAAAAETEISECADAGRREDSGRRGRNVGDRAMDRLKSEAPTALNVIFGPLSHEEWIAINLRHAELHLGFFIAE